MSLMSPRGSITTNIPQPPTIPLPNVPPTPPITEDTGEYDDIKLYLEIVDH